MIYIIKNYSFLVISLILLTSKPAYNQDLFDSLHTAQYANYLFLSGNYRLAIDEYERLIYLYNNNDPSRLRLVQSLRLAGEPGIALQRLNSFWDEPDKVSTDVSKELLRLHITTGNYNYAIEKAKETTSLAERDKLFFESSALMLNENFHVASSLLQDSEYKTIPTFRSYIDLSNEALSMKLKSPVLSGMFSAIIPGSGKFYTGEWQDGLMSLAFVGSTAWQTYRGFDKNGIKSPYAWIMGAISTGFYFGNIYGSVKSANKYNSQKKYTIKQRVVAVFNNHSF